MENGLRRKLDVVMGEDNCRIRFGVLSRNTGPLPRRLAINLLNNITRFQSGMKRKMRKAAISTSYMVEVLEAEELFLEGAATAQL